MNATEIAAALSARAEDVCRRYLPRGRKQGRYWTIGDTSGANGSQPWRLQDDPENGPMLRCSRSHRRATSSAHSPITAHRRHDRPAQGGRAGDV